MRKTHFKSVSVCLFASSLLACLVFARAAPDQDTLNRMGEISARMMELQQKLAACGSAECQQKIGQEITALSQQYQALSQSGGQAQQQGCPTCASFFKPGWSCLPLKMQVTDKTDNKGYGSYPVGPGDWKWYVAFDCVFAYNATGSGILTYTKDFKEFSILVSSLRADNHVTQFSWKKTSAGYSGYTNQNWSSSSGPQGAVKVTNPCGLSIEYPPKKADPGSSLPDFHYEFNELKVSCDDEVGGAYGTRVPYTDSPPFQVTPEMAKAMVASRQFSKTFAWRLKTGAGKDDPSYEDHNLTIKLEVGEPPPPEKPGILAVSPSDGFSSSRQDPKQPFAPLSKTYTLKNTGDKAINNTVSKKANWLNVDSTGGTLPPKGSATATVSVNVPVASKLPEDTYKDAVTFTNTTDGKGNTTRPADVTLGEEQTWQVFLTGYEIDEMNPYWKITTKVRGAIRFDYKLRGEFTIFKKKGKWNYKSGTITIAEVGLSDLHEPIGVWMVKPLKCVNCDKISNMKGQALTGTVDGNIVKLYWGKPLSPKVNVSAKIIVPCKPMPNCAQWGTRWFISEEFFQRINWYPLLLKHEYAKPLKVVSPQGLRWVNADFTLRRLK